MKMIFKKLSVVAITLFTGLFISLLIPDSVFASDNYVRILGWHYLDTPKIYDDEDHHWYENWNSGSKYTDLFRGGQYDVIKIYSHNLEDDNGNNDDDDYIRVFLCDDSGKRLYEDEGSLGCDYSGWCSEWAIPSIYKDSNKQYKIEVWSSHTGWATADVYANINHSHRYDKTQYNGQPTVTWNGYTPQYTQPYTMKCTVSGCPGPTTSGSYTSAKANVPAANITRNVTSWPTQSSAGNRNHVVSGNINGYAVQGTLTKSQAITKLSPTISATALTANYNTSMSLTANVPNTTNITVSVTGYQWQYSANNSTWTNLTNANGFSGVATKTLTIKPTSYLADTHKYIRCVMSIKLTNDYNTTQITTQTGLYTPSATINWPAVNFKPAFTGNLTSVDITMYTKTPAEISTGARLRRITV